MGIKEKKLLKELEDKGFPYKNVQKIFEKKALFPIEVSTIMKWLPGLYEENVAVADTLVRSLISAKEAFDPALLIDLFEHSDLNSSLKSGIGLALAYGRTTDISEWMKKQLQYKEFRSERNPLIRGLVNKGKFQTIKEFMSFMKKIFDVYHNDEVLKLFKKYGDKDDMLFLAKKAKTADPKLAKAINKVIEKKKV